MCWPTDVVLSARARGSLAKEPRAAVRLQNQTSVTLEPWVDGDTPDPNPVVRFENCDFIIGAANFDQVDTNFFWDVDHRGRVPVYSGCTVTINEPDSTPGTPALPSGNVDPIPV